MIRLLTIISVFALPSFIMAIDECPFEYRRFSTDHSFCKASNARCSFISKGIQNEAEITEILDIHNSYRSKVAMGEEKLAGGLPSASNMLEMSWDEELAEIAQKWAEQCNFEHDCNECRASKSFHTGQCITYTQYPCDNRICENKKTNWTEIIARFYAEVKYFNKKLVSAVELKTSDNKAVGHFTQVIWAETWKVGCGYVAHKQDDEARQFYVCNYGPSGNLEYAPVYKEGPVCAECPENSCCGVKCEGKKKTYPGLCKLFSSPPIYRPKQKPLYFCSFEKSASCEFDSEGVGEWKLSKTNGGTFLRVILKEKQSSSANFRQTIRIKKESCMNIYLRKGPTVAGEKDDSMLEVEFDQNGQKSSVEVWYSTFDDFIRSPVQVYNEGNLKISLKFTVPAYASPQYLEIKQIEIIEEVCKYEK